MKKTITVLTFLLFCTVVLVFSPPVFGQVPEKWENLGTAISNRPDYCVKDGVATLQGFECIFTNITRILTPVVGLLLFIMLIVGSFQLITAGGEAKSIQKARQTLTFAIAGIVIFIGIWFILQLIKAITGVDVTIFRVPS